MPNLPVGWGDAVTLSVLAVSLVFAIILGNPVLILISAAGLVGEAASASFGAPQVLRAALAGAAVLAMQVYLFG